MSKVKIIIGFILCMTVIITTNSFTTPVERAKLNIRIEHFVGGRQLSLDSVEYKNALGQVFTVSRFRYYLSNVTLKNADGATFQSQDYFLVDESVQDSKLITLTGVPVGTYSSISFTIGVDSLHNCSGAQSGALDPINGMFWTWNTGYIFLKLEGHANASVSPGHIFEYHIGGYMAPNNCIRQVTLNFRKKGLHIANDKTDELPLKCDILKILKKPVAIDFSKLSSVTDFHNATTIADNYQDMFTINADE
jgi:hypothetical protein